MKKVKFEFNEDIYFISLFFLNLAFLLYGISNLSISFYESDIFYNEKSALNLLTNFSCSIFGQNEYALRLPFVSIHFINLILMYKLSKKILKRRLDRISCITLYSFTPGIIAGAILVNLSVIIIFFTLLFMYLYEIKKVNISLFILCLTVFIDRSFLILYIGVFCYFIYVKDRKSYVISFLLIILSMLFYDINVGGKPRGFLADTIGIYAAVFSPLLFLFFVYSMYRIWIKEEKTLLWFIVIVSFGISLILSLRQKLELDEFIPYVVISIPLLIKTFYNSYRIRLPNFRKTHRLVAIFVILVLILFSSFLVFNQFLYLNIFKNNPEKHFIYKYDIAKDIAKQLKTLNLTQLNILDKKLALRLRFYGIDNYYKSKFTLSNEYFKEYRYKIEICKFNKIVDNFYILW